MTDAARLLREIAANPAADVLRLAFADAIEERDGPGDEAWAVFVRVQVWASQCEVCHGERTFRYGDYFCSNCQPHYDREREIWNDGNNPLREWTGTVGLGVNLFVSESEANQHPGYPALIVRRGFPAVVRCTLAEWRGEPCAQCSGRGHRTLYGDGSGPWAKCQYCVDGRTTGIGPRLAQRWPVEWVRATDKRPWENSLNESPARYTWLTTELVDTRTAGNRDRLPPAIFEILHPWATYRGIVQAGFDTEHDALAALSRALIAWARRKEQPCTT